MAIAVSFNSIFLLVYLFILVQIVSNVPLPQKENNVVLSAYIRRYEPAIYDPENIQRQQRRLRRSTGVATPQPLRINITASHRIFKLVLYPETSLFASDVVFETDDNRSLQYDAGKTYQGTLEDDPSAVVHGLLTSAGLFDGTVTTRRTRYYIEPSSRYLSNPSSAYHTVVYSEEDVIKPARESCASEELRKREEGALRVGNSKEDEKVGEDLQKIRRKKQTPKEDGRVMPSGAERRRGVLARRKQEDEKKRKEQEALLEKTKQEEEEKLREMERKIAEEQEAAKKKYEKEIEEELERRREEELLVRKELEARRDEEKLREEELERRKQVELLRLREEEVRKEELERRKVVEDLREKEAAVVKEQKEMEGASQEGEDNEEIEEEMKRKEDFAKQKEERGRLEEEIKILEEDIEDLKEAVVRQDKRDRRKGLSAAVRRQNTARHEADIRLKEDELTHVKDELVRTEELLRREEELLRREEEEMRRSEELLKREEEEEARKKEDKLRQDELERRKQEEVLRLEEEKARREELLKRQEVDLLVLREQEAREKEELARTQELERRKEVETLRQKEANVRQQAEVLRLEEEKTRNLAEFRRKELQRLRNRKGNTRQPSAERPSGNRGSDRNKDERNKEQYTSGADMEDEETKASSRRPGGSERNVETGSGRRARSTEEYFLSRTMRDEAQDIDTILRVEAPNKTIISISKPGIKMNSTHRNILVNTRPSEYDDNLDQFDSFFNRNPKFSIIDAKKTTCMLYLQADHLFYEKYGSEESCIEVMTRHVQRVNAIYKNTDFNQDGTPDNITFMIKRIKVHTQDSMMSNLGYRFQGNYGVEKFLEIFSEEDYDAFCLAYMFTYRDFEMGTLGLAWTGDLKNAGGVCEKNGHYRGSMKSLNTGIVTLLNYGKHVPPAVSHVTLAHEIGHNFGSPHDPEICTPGGDDGNYIMFARATSGDKKNNNKFSQCSLNSINPVLNTKARSGKGCFIQPQVSLCGNGVVEEGEECDCGWEDDCKDVCCHPQRRYPTLAAKPCTLSNGSHCSPSQGPCCTAECRLKTGDKCRDDNGCRDSSFCNGKQPQCPPSINKPNKTVCNAEFVCYMGECTGSICLAYGLESCQCIPGPGDSATKACELCCKMPGENQPCLSSFLLNTPPYDVPDMYSKPGTPCNDYNGYCDVFQKCREVDPSGPLATLRKLLLSDESIDSFKKWALEHWYYSGLMFLSFLLILVLSARLFGKESDRKKTENVTILHSSTTETVRLPPDLAPDAANVTVHPAVVRSKLPFKKKVRERSKSSGQGKESSRKIAKKLIDKNLKKNIKPLAKIGEEDPLGKVRNWLLHSHHLSNGLSSLRKSKSSPAGFVPIEPSSPTGLTPEVTSFVPIESPDVPVAPLITIATDPPAVESSSPAAPAPVAPREGSDNEVKLQVVFKPPFKFIVKLRKPNKVDVKKAKGAKAEKTKDLTLVVEEMPSAELKPTGKGKVAKHKQHKLLADNVPEPVKKRAALLIRADKTLKRNPKPKKPRPSADLARLISQESEVPSEPVYENADVPVPGKEKLDKLTKHSRNVEALVKRQSSTENTEVVDNSSKRNPDKDEIRKKHRSKRKKPNEQSHSHGTYKIEKRHSMSDVPKVCDPSQGPGPKLNHSSSEVKIPESKRHSMSELPQTVNSHRNRLPSDNILPTSSKNLPSNSHNVPSSSHFPSSSSKLSPSHSKLTPPPAQESKRHSLSDLPSQMHIYENLLDSELFSANQSARHGTRASLNISHQTGTKQSFKRHSNERVKRATSREAMNSADRQGNVGDRTNNLDRRSSENLHRLSNDRNRSSSSLNRSSNPTHSDKRHRTNSSSNPKLGSSSNLKQTSNSALNEQSPRRANSLQRSQSHTNNVSRHDPNSSPVTRNTSSHDLMRFPSLETEANTRLDYLISGKK